MTIDKTKNRLRLFMTGLISLTIWASASLAGHGPGPCAGCLNGTCHLPRRGTFGYNRPHWRPWIGSTTYEGYKQREPELTVPDVTIPEMENEARVTPRTRTTQPMNATTPRDGGATSGSPFDNIVPEASLPPNRTDSSSEGTGGLDELGGLGDLLTPPAETPAIDPLPPAGAPDPALNPGTLDLEDPPADDDLFNSIHRSSNRLATRQTIKNRKIQLQADRGPKEIVGAVVDVPQYETLGGPFSLSDLLPPSNSQPAPKRRPDPPRHQEPAPPQVIQPVSHTDATAQPLAAEALEETVVNSGNPLRPRKPLVLKKPTPGATVKPSPIQTAKPQRKPQQLVERPHVQLQPVPSKSASALRVMPVSAKRSLRTTLRKNPLR